MTQNQTIAAVVGAVAITAAAAAFFAIESTAQLAWYKTSDLPDTTPNDYKYDWHVQLPSSNIECYHNWRAQPAPIPAGQPPFNEGQIFRDSVLMPGVARLPPEFRCNPIDNIIWVIGTDGNWYRWNPTSFDWDQDQLPSGTPFYPTRTEIPSVACSDAANNPLGWRCLTPFAPIGALLPDANGGQIHFYLRARFGDAVSPDSAFLLIGVLGSPQDVRLVPIS